MTLLEQLEAATALNEVAAAVGIDRCQATRFIRQIVAHPHGVLVVEMMTNLARTSAEQRSLAASVHKLSDYRRKTNR